MREFALIPRELSHVDTVSAERALGFMPLRVKLFKILLWGSGFILGSVMLIYPVWPMIQYNFGLNANNTGGGGSAIAAVPEKEGEDDPQEEHPVAADNAGNKLVIPKIDVDIDILGGSNAEYAWTHGAWIDPDTSTPNNGSNTVLSAHRFRYLPPYKETFYLLDKLEIGDTFTVYWEGEVYTYTVDDIKIVSPYDISVLDPTPGPVVTLYTCHPLFSTKERLVVRGSLTNR